MLLFHKDFGKRERFGGYYLWKKVKKNYIEKIMAAKAMENMTGRKEKLSEFERKKAQKELQKLSELLK